MVKAAVMTGFNEPLAIDALTLKAPREDEIVVRVVASGVCHSDLFALEEKSIVGSLYGSGNMQRDVPRLIDLYMHKRIKIDELVSRKIGLNEVNSAFAAMENGEVARSVIVHG